MKSSIYNKILIILICLLVLNLYGQEWESSILSYNLADQLEYIRDEEGNRIPDFSFAGYKNGNVGIPEVEIVKSISSIDGDNTNHINLAILEAALFNSLDENGFKGAVYLNPGIYEVYGTINIKSEGVVIRGAGNGMDSSSNSIIIAKENNPHQRSVMTIGGGELTTWGNQVANSKSLIVDDTVFVGENSFSVENPSSFNVGDNIIIYHPCSEEWLEAINYGGTHSDESGAEEGIDIPWTVGSQPIIFNRNIIEIEGDLITIDVPIYNHLIKELSQSYIYKFNPRDLVRNVGVESIRIVIESSGNLEDENHAWDAINFIQVEDAWAKDCTVSGFGRSGFRTSTSTRVTIENCNAIDPVSIITGGRRYNFNTYRASQEILFKNCFASNGRHHFMSNGTSTVSGIVFYNCQSKGAYASSEGHRRWSMGILWDNLKEIDGPRSGYNPRLLGLYNRGYYGTSHGWSAAHSVAWNCNVNDGDLVVQKPPTAQNYAIGCFGNNISGMAQSTFEEPEGYIEGSNKPGLRPKSLYIAQLNERNNVTSVERTPNSNAILNKFMLSQNFPNPFNNSTQIIVRIVEPDNYKLLVYNGLGQKIAMLFNGYLEKGQHNFTYSSSNNASGVYYYKFQNKNSQIIKKMVYLS